MAGQNEPGGTLYVGVTNDLIRRICEHREGLADSFTKRYGVKMFVYFEPHATIEAALQREKKALVARMESRSRRQEQSTLARTP